MVFIIDFDNTLSNNDLLVVELKNAFEKVIGYEKTQLFWQKNNNFKDHDVLVNFPYISRDYLGNDVLKKVFSNIHVKAALYNKTTDFLDKLTEKGKVYIFTEGDLEFQKAKIDNSGIHEHVDGVYIYESKMGEFKDIANSFADENIFYIDDKTSNLVQAKASYPKVKTVWVRQGYYKDVFANDPGKIDVIVNSLEELFNYDF